LPLTVAIPDKFTFVDVQAKTRPEAVVVWRKNDLMGVRFA
jgi:hypothetical protein